MLSEEVQEFLDACGYQAKKETLKVVARLSEKGSFSKAAEAVRGGNLHGAGCGQHCGHVEPVKRRYHGFSPLRFCRPVFLKCRQSSQT